MTGSLAPGLDSRVVFFELMTRAEGDGTVVVGRADTGDFVAVPELGATIIRELSGGARVGEVERRLARTGVAIDVAGFVQQLGDFGFVRAVDGVPDRDAPAVRPPSLRWLQARHVRWLFTPPAYVTYLLVVAAALVTLILQPRVRPHYGDIFFSGSTSVVLVGSTALVLAIAALHEFAHLASARASGVPARISFSTRLYSLAAQTDVSGLWAASPPERVRTYLAGMGMDLVLGSALILIRATSRADDRASQVMAAAVVLILAGIAGQFMLFTRTDGYFVAAELLRAGNLFEDATVQVIYALRAAVGKAPAVHPLAGLPRREHRIVKAYSVAMVLGTLAALAVFAVFLLPAIVILLVHGADRLATGVSSGDLPMSLDGAVTLVLEGGTELLVIVLMLRSRAQWINHLRRRLRRSGRAR